MHLRAFGGAFAAQGPMVTACLDVTRDNENAAAELDLRWRALREELADQGAPPGALDVVEERLLREIGEAGEWGRAVAATATEVLVDRVFPGRPRPHGVWSRLPHLMPLFDAESAAVAYILVEVDRVGADITVSARAGTWSQSVEGEDHHIRKVAVGGWAHRRYYETAENLWDQNASQVAARIDRLVVDSGAELVVVAGDVRACQLVRDNVSERTRPLLHLVEGGGRAAGAGSERVADEITSLKERLAAQRARAAAEVFREQQASGGRAAAGLSATVEALRRAQVDTLLVPSGWDDHEPAWFGPDPTLFGLKIDELTALGVPSPEQALVVDVVLRAAVGTDARLVVVPEHVLPLGGEPAALLRFADESTPQSSTFGSSRQEVPE